MIVSAHVASGALAGSLLRSPRRAALAGIVLHGVADRLPHEDVASRRFEIVSGVLEVLALALARGPRDAAVAGALAAAAPDLEHVLRLPRPGGRKLYPTHRVRGWHPRGGLPAWLQLLAAGILLGAVAPARRCRE